MAMLGRDRHTFIQVQNDAKSAFLRYHFGPGDGPRLSEFARRQEEELHAFDARESADNEGISWSEAMTTAKTRSGAGECVELYLPRKLRRQHARPVHRSPNRAL